MGLSLHVGFFASRRTSKDSNPSVWAVGFPSIGRDDRLGARDDLGWRIVEPLDQRLYVGARHESELEVHLGALGDELRVAHRLGKGFSQRRCQAWIEAGRSYQRPAHRLPR